MNDFIENLPGIAFCCLFTALQTYLLFNGRIGPEENQKIIKKYQKNIDDFFIKSEEKLKLINEKKQQLIYDYRKKHAENGIILLGNYPLKKDFNLSKFINEIFAYRLKDIGFHEYLYLTDSYRDFCFSKDIDPSIISNPKRAITIGGRAEEYLREKKINLGSKSIKIAVLLKIQKNKKPKIRFKLKQQL